ncbi:2Fe-2S iron-sulfur cluster-binding protein [Vibrio maerlii]|uniref:2Fe-2S iron-sulfur cluster-binding protein n=1 Tax=Vibrio maerlii TaxID=2231648 RepID=UPI000E3E3990|nr:2Fe-2S iron-sulfur cluster-binding protein [Vibrio maerlii]
MSQVKINGQVTIVTNPSQTILDAMETNGLEAEYHCRDGHCGACRCKLISGETETVGFAMAYTQPDEILPCISKAKTDIEIDKVQYSLKQRRA